MEYITGKALRMDSQEGRAAGMSLPRRDVPHYQDHGFFDTVSRAAFEAVDPK